MRGLICGLVIGAFIQWYTDRPTAPAPTVAAVGRGGTRRV